ncbi:actin-related protein 5 isoform X1 [Tanacetum coccineum]|uniref:Actin-related protein 5 isoform X1 n=1 Tax=Tanacetum coccineum TaxID=301880 RepID=A0ABQ4ZSD4_9ASTR
MPFICKTKRQTDYNLKPSSCLIVIDNGSSYFRIGWAGESEPRIIFRNIVQRPRHKFTGETETVVGDHDLALLRYFDCTRSGPRSAFENDVVYQFEIMEYILDFAFDRLGADRSPINHPILMTECACNAVHSRSKMVELLFDTYGVPSIAFGVDAAFSYTYNQQRGICDKDGLAICSGFNTSHVIPFINLEPVYEACCRTNVGGYHTRAKEAEENTRYWQLSWTPTPVEEPTSEEEVARKAALRERQGQRLLILTYQYAVFIKEDTAYTCTHQRPRRKQDQYAKAREDEGDMDVSWDITIKDIERLSQFLTPTIHALPNLEPVMPLGPFHDTEEIIREREQDYDIPLNDGEDFSDITKVAEIENDNPVKDVMELSDIKTYDCETFIRKLLHQVPAARMQISSLTRPGNRQYPLLIGLFDPLFSRNQGASVKALEIQIGQISKVLQERGSGGLPSSTKINPRDHVKSISTTVESEVYPIRRIKPLQYVVSMPQNSSKFFQKRWLMLRFLSRLYDSCWNEEEESEELHNLHVYSYESSILEDNLPQKEKDPGSFTLPCFINNVCFNKALADLGASVSVMAYSTYITLRLGSLVPTKLIVELANRTVKHPKGIAENVLVGIDKFTFPIDFLVLNMPEDIKTSLILGRPFLSMAHAKIHVFKRKIALRVGNEKVVFQTRLMGEALIMNRSQDPDYRDFLKLNDLNEPLELRRNQVVELRPTIKEGEVIDAPIEETVKARKDSNEIVDRIKDYPTFCDHDRKIHVDGAYNLKFSCMIGYKHLDANFFPLLSINMMSKSIYNSIMKDKMEFKGKNVVGAFMNVPIFVGTFCVVIDFAVMENMYAYRDKEMGDVIVRKEFCKEIGVKAKQFEGMITIYNGNDEVSAQDELDGISHSYKKLKRFYKGVLNLGPEYIKDEKVKEWLTHGHCLPGDNPACNFNFIEFVFPIDQYNVFTTIGYSVFTTIGYGVLNPTGRYPVLYFPAFKYVVSCLNTAYSYNDTAY